MWWRAYEHLVGQEMRCCLCGKTERLKDPYSQLHPPMRAHYGRGRRWYTNASLRNDASRSLLRFFVCPPCQGERGANLHRAWEWARREGA